MTVRNLAEHTDPAPVQLEFEFSPHGLDEASREELYELYSVKRWGIARLRTYYQAPAKKVTARLRAEGIQVRASCHPRGRRNVDTAALAEAYNGGASGPELARELGVDSETVYVWLEEAGVKRRPLGRVPKAS